MFNIINAIHICRDMNRYIIFVMKSSFNFKEFIIFAKITIFDHLYLYNGLAYTTFSSMSMAYPQ